MFLRQGVEPAALPSDLPIDDEDGMVVWQTRPFGATTGFAGVVR